MTESTNRFTSWEDAVRWLREQPDQQDLVHDGYYDDPLLHAAERYRCSDEWQAVRVLLPTAPGHALDVGAGRGIASYALASEGFQVAALEPDPSALVGAGAIEALARETGLSIEVKKDFSEQLPYADASFDVVLARAVLHHTRDLGAACREFHRVLKPGGFFLALREHVISKPEDLEAFLSRHPLHSLYGGENAFLLREYRAALEAAGFSMRAVLAPLDSPINLAPHTHATFCKELSERTLGSVPQVATMLASILAMPPVWAVLRRALRLVDHRPGRLYSFIAVRP